MLPEAGGAFWHYLHMDRWRWIGEERIDFERLRRERLERAKKLLADSSMGALLCFDMNNVRYITATHIGTWAQDKTAASLCCRRTASR